MKQMDLCVCQCCGKEFLRRTTEVKRQERRQAGIYCSLSCATRCINRLGVARRNSVPPSYNGDSYTPIRYRFNKAKAGARKRGIPFNLTLDEALNLWNNQGGKCPYTGWSLLMPPDGITRDLPRHRLASLDRIDSNGIYEIGNVQWVSQIVNMAKHDYSETALLEFCLSVTQNRGLQ